MKLKFDESKIAETYSEKLAEIQHYKIQSECLDSLRKAVMTLSKARVEYMTSGSQNGIIQSIFELEKRIHTEIFDIENLD